MAAAAYVPAQRVAPDMPDRLMPPVLGVLPTPVAAVSLADRRILAANQAWHSVAKRYAAGAPDTQLTTLFPSACALLDDPELGGGGICRRAVPAIVPPSGVATWWDIEIVAYPDEPGVAIVTARDVTEDVLAGREAEDAQKVLSAAGMRLGLVEAATGIGIWEWHLATDSQSWSPMQFRLFGLDPARDSPPPFAKFIDAINAEDRSAVTAAIECGFRNGQGPHALEYRLRRADTGEERWILSLGRPLSLAPDGKPLRVVGVNIDITKQRRAQSALQASEARLRLGFDAAQIFAWDWDLPTGRVTWTDGGEAAFGMPQGGFGGTIEHFRALVHPDDAALVSAALNRALRGETARYEAEFRMRRHDGSWRWTRSRGQVIRDTDSQPVRIIGVDHDVTEQRVAEAALRESENRLRLAMESADLGAWEANCATGVYICDATLAALLGHEPEQFVADAKGWFDAVHPDDRARVLADFQAPLHGSAPYRSEFRVIRADGKERIFTGSGVLAATGRMIGVAQDVTAARAAESAVRESRSRFQGLFDGMFQYTGLLALDGTVVKANRAALTFGGVPLKEVVGRKLWDARWFSNSEDSAAAVRHAVHSAAAGNAVRYETEIRGNTRNAIIDFSLQPVRDDDGNIIHLAAEGRDITGLAAARNEAARRVADLEALLAERTRALGDAGRELEMEMRRRGELQTALLQAQKLEALGHLTGSVAHDFNNVLTAISGSYNLIRRQLPSAPVLDIVTSGEQAAARASALIQQLLAFMRREELTPQMLDVAGTLTGLKDLIRHAAGEQIRCTLNVQPGLWPVLADSHQLGIAILNLAVNARDAMPRGGELRITARNLAPEERPASLTPESYISIAACDNGDGMSPEILARAREPFFTTKMPGKGTGLGLSMVHDFAAKAGGGLRIASTPGRGTTVEIILPHAALLASSTERKAAMRQISAEHYALHGNATILLVENDEQLRPMTAGYLRDLGYDVAEAASAGAALALFHALGHVDLLITDMSLPGEDGVTLARRLSAENGRLAVLFATGLHGISAEDSGRILQKPYADTVLAKAVLKSLGRRVTVDTAVAEPMLSRMSSARMRSFLVAWHRAKADGEGFPRPGLMDPEDYGLGAHAFTADVSNAMPPSFHYLKMGNALSRELARVRGADPVATGLDEDEVIGTLDGAYRRCQRTRSPVFQSADYEFGDGTPFHFERLILPAALDGQAITHLIGVVLFGTRIGDELP